MSTKQDGWKAIRRGPIYCAPLCGGRCTWSAYQKAIKHATAMVKRLGKGWKIRVHENLGWHYCAVLTLKVNGKHGPMELKVYEERGRSKFISAPEVLTYWTMFGSIGGEYQWQPDGHSATPEEAVKRQLRAVSDYVNKRDNQLAALNQAIMRPCSTS